MGAIGTPDALPSAQRKAAPRDGEGQACAVDQLPSHAERDLAPLCSAHRRLPSRVRVPLSNAVRTLCAAICHDAFDLANAGLPTRPACRAATTLLADLLRQGWQFYLAPSAGMRGISPLTKDSNHALALAIALALGTFTNNAIVCRSTRQNAPSRASVTFHENQGLASDVELIVWTR